jgi:hypothetical protein
MPNEPFDAAWHAGFGLASFLIVLGLIAKLVSVNRISGQDAREVIDQALLNAETNQSISPSPEVVQAARRALEISLTVLEAKLDQLRRDQPRSP